MEDQNQYIREIRELLELVAQSGGSDLHLLAGHPAIIRVNGLMTKQDHLRVLQKEDIHNLVYSLLSEALKAKYESEKELDFSYEIPEVGRFRINIHFEKGSPGLVARLIPFEIPSMEDLHVSEIAKRLAMMPHGLVLCTGPAGMGKSTLLASMIEFINTNANMHIITLEDPIEYLFSSKQSFIRQRELGTDMVSFKEGLRHVLRQDPNVVMIGEMRDLETVASALTLAETGHLILATLHTNSAAQSIDRIIDFFPAEQQDQVRFQLAMVLEGVITLRLLPAASGGRTPAQEILLRNNAVSNLIRSDQVNQIDRVIQTSREEGMMSMDQAIAELYLAKSITREVALSNIQDETLLK